MACKYTNPHTGNELFLAQKLKEYYKLDDSQESSDFLDSKVSFFYSPGFTEIFGDWLKEKYEEDNRIDAEGAPKLFKDGENFYVLDKNNEKYFINNQRFEGLEIYPDMYSKLSSLKEEASSMIVKYIFNKYKNNEDDITDITNTEFNLENEVEAFFKEQIKEVPEAEDHFNILLKFKEDFTNEVKDFLKSINLTYNEPQDIEDEAYQENLEDNGAILGTSSIEKNSKDNATSSVKLMMSLLADTTSESDFFIGYKLLPFSKVWNDVQASLVNMSKLVDENNNVKDPYNAIIDNLTELSNDKPYIKELISTLNSSNDNLKTQFVQAFFNNGKYIQDSLSYNSNRNSYKLVNAAESASKKSKLLTEVGLEFKALYTTFNTETGKRIFDLKSYENNILKPYLGIFKNSKDENRGTYFRLNDLINNIGFNINEKDFYHFVLNNSEAEFIKPDLLLNKLKEFYTGFNFFNKTMITDMNDREKTVNYATALLFSQSGKYLNPFKGENNKNTSQSIFEEIVDVIAYFDTDLSENMFFSGDKSMWVYSLSSHLNDAVNIFNNDEAYVNKLKNLPFTKNSVYLNNLIELRKQGIKSDVLKIHRNNSFFDEDQSSDAKDNVTTSKRDAVNRDIYEALLAKIGSKSIFSTAVPADKATGLKIETSVFIDSGIFENEGQLFFGDEVLKIFSNYFNDELSTANEAKNHILNNMDNEGNVDVSKMIQYKHVTADGYTFQVLDASNKVISKFNNINAAQKLADENKDKGYRMIYAGGVFKNYTTPALSPENLLVSKDKSLFGLFYNKDFTPNLISSEFTSTQKDKLNYLINILLNEINNVHIETLKENKVFNYTGTNASFDRAIYNQYLSEYGISQEFATTEESNTIFKKIVSDYTVNTLISQIEFSKLFNGSINNHKNAVDYFKRVPKTYIDGKGLRLGVTEHDHVFNVTVLQDVETSSPYIDQMGEVGKKFYSDNKINQADAQAYITPERWKFLLERLGQFGKVEQKIYDKIRKSYNGEDVEFDSKELKKLSTKPLKGVYFSNIDNNPVYLKYSQTVLLPSLVKGSPLEGLLKQMRKQNISEAIMNSGVKVGAQLTEVNTSQQILNNEKFKLNSIQLDNRFWKLQQDLPNKGFKQTLLGSQIQKNIFDNFNFTATYNFNNKELSGSEVYNNIHNVIGEMSSRGIAKIIEKFKVGSEYVINDWSAFAKDIAAQLREEKINENIVKAVEKELTPFVVPQAKDKILSTIMSIINKAAVKLKTNGGSLIQMSNYGLDQNLAEETGIIWLKDKQQLAEPRKILQENGKPLVLPGQVFISGNILGQYVPEWRNYKTKEGNIDLDKLFGKDRQGGLFPKEILQMIGYRIPNQAMSSNDALEIVGILPDSYIDTIIPYTGITTKTGSDFDIDKMFIMLPSMTPIYSMKPDAYQYVYNTFKGKNLSTTVANLTSFLSELTNDTELDIEKLSNALYSNLTIEELISDLKTNTKSIVDIIVNKDNKDNPIVKKILKEIDAKVVKVKYDTFKTDKEGNELSLKSQSQGALNNRLFEMYHMILTHPDNYDSLITPIDHAHIKDYITKDLMPKSNKLKNYQAFSSLYQIDMKYEFIAGKFGIGQVANQLVDSVSNQTAQEHLNSFLGWGNFKEVDAVKKDGTKYKKKVTVFDMVSEKGIYDELGKYKITDTLTALLNGFVDIAKDPYITRGNWNTQTTNTGAMLIRAGVNPFKVAGFLAQPALIKMVDIISQREGIIANEGTSATVIDELKEEYLKELQKELNLTDEEFKIFKKEIDSKSLNTNIILGDIVTSNKITERSAEHLKNNVRGTNNKSQILLDQYLSLLEYDRLKPIVKDFTKSVTSAKYGETGVGKSLVDFIVKKNKISEVVNKGLILNFDKKFFNKELLNDGFTSLGHYHKNTENFFNNLVHANPKIFLTASNYFKNIMNDIASEVHKNKKYLDDVNLGKIIEQAFYSLTISGSDLFKLSEETININGRNISKDFLYLFTKSNKYVETTLSDIIAQVKTEFPDNYLLRNIEIKEDEGYSFIGIDGIRRKPNDFTDKIINGWKELDKIYPDLSKDLVKYAFLQSGFRYNANQIYQYIPHEILIKNNFNNYLTKVSDLIKNSEIDPEIIKDSIYRHNSNNTKLVPAISAKEFSKSYILEGQGTLGFRIKYDSKRYTDEGIIGDNKLNTFSPYITNDGKLFKLYKYMPLSKEVNGKVITVYEPIYFKTHKLGYKSDKGQVQEFDMFKITKESNIKANNNTEVEQEFIDSFLNHPEFQNFISPDQVFVKKLDLPTVTFGENILISENNYVSLQEDNNESMKKKSNNILQSETEKFTDEYFKELDDANIKEQLLTDKNYSLLTIEELDVDGAEGVDITQDNIEEALNNLDRILYMGSETNLVPIYKLKTENGYIEFDVSSKIIYEQDYLKEKDPVFKEEARLMLNSLGFDLKTEEELKNSFIDPNQLSLFDGLPGLEEDVSDKSKC